MCVCVCVCSDTFGLWVEYDEFGSYLAGAASLEQRHEAAEVLQVERVSARLLVVVPQHGTV